MVKDQRVTFELVLGHLRKRDFAVLSTVSKATWRMKGTAAARFLPPRESWEASERPTPRRRWSAAAVEVNGPFVDPFPLERRGR